MRKRRTKASVLTPWRVVNLHMAETLGGWCFYGRDFPEEPLEDGPRKVAFEDSGAGGTSETVFSKSGAKILEINSKSGLYPLYCAYSLYRARLGDVPEEAVKPAETARIWRDVLAKQVFVVCKTPQGAVAKSFQNRKRDWQLEILDNHSAFGRARVALGLFDTRTEAENFFRYCQTPLVRFLFLMTDEALTSLAKEVPDIGDYCGRSQLIDFKGDIGRQLAKLAGLSKTESDYAACRIADIDASRSKR